MKLRLRPAVYHVIVIAAGLLLSDVLTGSLTKKTRGRISLQYRPLCTLYCAAADAACFSGRKQVYLENYTKVYSD